MQHTPQSPITVEEAAEYLHISVGYLYRLTSESKIPHFKSRGGKLVYFQIEDLNAWAFGHRVATDEEIEQEAATRVVLVKRSRQDRRAAQ